MVATSKKKSAAKGKKVKVLSLKKETVKNLRSAEAKRVKGGFAVPNSVIRASNQVTTVLDYSIVATSGASNIKSASL